MAPAIERRAPHPRNAQLLRQQRVLLLLERQRCAAQLPNEREGHLKRVRRRRTAAAAPAAAKVR